MTYTVDSTAAIPVEYEGSHRDDTEAARKRDDRAFSHASVYGSHYVARHYEGFVR